MRVPVVFLHGARREFDHASNWYDQQRAGLGSKFTQAVQAVLDEIEVNPKRYPMEYLEVREAQISASPYCVYYRDDDTRATIVSVFHTAQDPAIWQSRV